MEPRRRSGDNVVTPAAKLVPNVMLRIPLDPTGKAERGILMTGQLRISYTLTQACVLERLLQPHFTVWPEMLGVRRHAEALKGQTKRNTSMRLRRGCGENKKQHYHQCHPVSTALAAARTATQESAFTATVDAAKIRQVDNGAHQLRLFETTLYQLLLLLIIIILLLLICAIPLNVYQYWHELRRERV